MTIRAKLLLIVALPIGVILGLAGARVRSDVVALGEMRALERSVDVAVEASALVDDLQTERGLSVLFLATEGARFPEVLRAQRAKTDMRVAQFRRDAAVVDRASVGAEWGRALGEANARIGDLARVRQLVVDRRLEPMAAYAWYGGLVDSILRTSREGERPITAPDLRRHVGALRRLRDGTERAGRERALLSIAFARGRLDRELFDATVAAHVESRVLFDDFLSQAPPVARTAFAVGEGDPVVVEAEKIRDATLRGGPDKATTDDAQRWFDVASTRMRRLHGVEDVVSHAIRAQVAQIHRATMMTAAFAALLALGTSVAVVFATVILARRILRRLQDAAALARRLARGDSADLPDIDVRGDEEVGLLMRAMRGALAYQHGVATVAERLAEGDLSAEVAMRSDRDVLSRSLATVLKALRRQREVEAELRVAQKLDAIERLAGGMAHEMGTPLQFVRDSLQFLGDACHDLLSFVRTLRDDLPPMSVVTRGQEEIGVDYLEERIPGAFARAHEGLDRVGEIIEQMKELAPSRGEDLVSLDLNRALEATLFVVRDDAEGIAELTTSFAEELPAVYGCARELNRVFVNLLVNAVQAIGGSGRQGTIRVGTHIEGPNVVVTIADDGPGIPEDIRGKIFDPFFTTRDVGAGAGQGLAIARSLVRKHHGVVTFESVVGSGTTFLVRLPIHVAAAAPPISSIAA